MTMDKAQLHRCCSLWLMICMLLSLSLLLFTNPHYTIGLWPESELLFIALNAISCSTAIGVLGLYVVQPKRITPLLYHPLVLCIFAIGVVSLLFSFSTAFPRRSWFGAPELGEGVMWYFSLAFLILSGLILRNKKIYRNIIGIYAVISALVVSLLTYKGDALGLWKPYVFTDYLAFYGIFLFPIIIGFLNVRQKHWIALSYLIASVPIIVSGNQSAEILIIVSPLVMGLVYYLRHLAKIRLLSVAAIMMAPIGVTGLVVLLGYYGARDASFLNHMQSIWSRYELIQTAYQNFKSDGVVQMLLGHGWGSFTDVAATYLPIQDTKLFMFNSTGTDKLYWDSLSRADFHSHSYLIEAFVSIGLLGMLLILLYPMIAVASTSAKRMPLAMGLAFSFIVVSAMWFQFAITLPFMGLAFAAVSSPILKAKIHFLEKLKRNQNAHIILMSVLFMSIGIFIYGVIEGYRLASHSTKFATPDLSKMATHLQCGDELGDMAYGGLRLGVVNHEVNYFLVHTEQETYPEDWYDKLDWLRCSVDRYLENGVSARFKIMDLLVRSEWAFSSRKQKDYPQVVKLLADWELRLDAFLQNAPTRTDLAAPYLMWRLSNQENDIAIAFAKKLYIRNMNDPVALWFLGLNELQDDTKAHLGIAKMRSALKYGIQNIIPIDQALIDKINA
ncbi:hypothetical protein CC99x_010505 [Candidatus Berkiella cookevillensis]|uniref:O-Antigen ligase n=1 Tax=Candidatus Berkiella cookevillensis TaxID=437022 RepID=A0A0Q9YHB4_9GAMM|nr:hypothetical protein [Candidatus Berkiella cookevillensis]MCS5709336.1 hypothetical protein [Candidatus Berkiella cookevillensis]